MTSPSPGFFRMMRRPPRPRNARLMLPARHLLLLVCLLGPCGVLADRAPESGHAAYQAALQAFEAGAYADAVDVLERLLDTDGSCAPCAHLLGKSYGRMAERAGWLEAVRLARKTQSALEQAVELAPEDPAALTDLIKYYRAAPSFLGGSLEKAEALERRLEALQASRPS